MGEDLAEADTADVHRFNVHRFNTERLMEVGLIKVNGGTTPVEAEQVSNRLDPRPATAG